MSTDVVEGAEAVVLASDDEEAVVGDLEGFVAAGFGKSAGVGEVKPGLAEDGAGFEGELGG